MVRNIAMYLGLILICTSAAAQSISKEMFIFGHSLIDHRPPAIATPNDETSVPFWLNRLADATGDSFAGGGIFGGLRPVTNPITSQWGWSSVPGVWDHDTETFAETSVNTILMTALNYIQWQGPADNYYLQNESPLDAARDLIDWVNDGRPNADITVYLNWPDMAGYITGSFPPTSTELANYHNATQSGSWYDWWITFQDSLIQSRPTENIKMIPVGPIMSNLLNKAPLNAIAVTDLYEDDAPHGRPTLYYLAAIITYMGTYEKTPVAITDVDNQINDLVETNYQAITDDIWSQLQSFNFADGSSRVFRNNNSGNPDNDGDNIPDNDDNCPTISNPDQLDSDEDGIGNVCDDTPMGTPFASKLGGGALFIDNDEGIILRGQDGNCYRIFIDINGALQHSNIDCPQN